MILIKKRSPVVSVVTATYNCADTVADCIDSVVGQRYEDIEHIVVDGASTDDTLDVISRYSHKIAKIISEPDQGIYHALNKGIHLASGDVIGFLHADDFYASDEVVTKIAKIFEDPSVCAVYGDLEYVRRGDVGSVVRRWRGSPFSQRALNWGWMPAHPTLYVRRSWYEKIGGFDIEYQISADYKIILKLFQQEGFRAIYVPGVFIKMRLGGISNKSIKAVFKKSSEDWNALRSCNFSIAGATWALVFKNLSKIPQFL